MRGKKSGFTLIEMLTVMGIAAIITIASAPAFMNFARTQRIRGTAGEIASALNSARRFAITRNTEYAVYIYGNDYGGTDLDLVNSFLFWETEGSTERKLIHRVVRVADVTGANAVGDGEYEFEFTSRGSLRGGNSSIVLEDVRGRTITITVYNTTGRVKIGDLED